MPTFELRPFTLPEAEWVAGWVTTPDELREVAATEEFPLSADQVAAWTYEADFVFTLRREGDLVAYGEIVEDSVEGDVEIQHLLVASDMRSVGIGKALLFRLCAFLAATLPYPEVWLRVGRENVPAAACARAVGFEVEEQMCGPRYLWMKKSLISPVLP